jgi:hypothetical protein
MIANSDLSSGIFAIEPIYDSLFTEEVDIVVNKLPKGEPTIIVYIE